MGDVLGVIAVIAGIVFAIWLICQKKRVILLVAGIVGFFIWGFSATQCPKCDGGGKLSRQVNHNEHKKDCATCKGKGAVILYLQLFIGRK